MLATMTTTAAESKINILLMVADDLRDTLGCDGNAAAKTPNMDRLAGRGVRSDRDKNTLFERSCRGPLIVCAPGAKAGQACRSPVELVDLSPTVIDYCGLTAAHDLAGRSLRPLLMDPTSPGKSAAFTLVVRDKGRCDQSVRTDRWRYTRWSDGTSELKDPQETHDLSGNPRYADEIIPLGKLLDQIGGCAAARPKSSP
jgi:arylsulfatase A-like enzyme